MPSASAVQSSSVIDTLSEDVEVEVVALIELLLVPVVPAVGMAEPEDPIAAVEVAVVRTLICGTMRCSRG